MLMSPNLFEEKRGDKVLSTFRVALFMVRGSEFAVGFP